MHNHLEIIAPILLTDGCEHGVIKHIAQMAQELPEWQVAYDSNYAAVVKNANRAAAEKMARQQQKPSVAPNAAQPSSSVMRRLSAKRPSKARRLGPQTCRDGLLLKETNRGSKRKTPAF